MFSKLLVSPAHGHMLSSFLQGNRGCGEVGARGGGGGGADFKREPSQADLKRELSPDERTRDGGGAGGGGGGGGDGFDPHPGCGKKRMYYTSQRTSILRTHTLAA